MSDSIEDRQEQYHETQDFFERFARQKGLELEELQKPEVRIDLIKQTAADQFLELMSVANSKLRGEYKRWKRDYKDGNHRAVVTSGLLDSPDLEPPSNSEQEFTAFYQEMQAEITDENIDLWSTKLYTAIVFLHMFPDGNGRLARNAFTFLSKGEMAKEDFSANRPSLIRDYCDTVNVVTIQQMLEKNGATKFNYKKLGGLHNTSTYSADERTDLDEYSEHGLASRLKFIAAKRASIIKARAKDSDENSVSQCFGNGRIIGFEGQADENGYGQVYSFDTEPWSPEETERYKEEFDKVRSEWFRESIQTVEDNAELTQAWLDIALNVPNPFFMKINTMLKIIAADSDRNQTKDLLDTDKFASHRSEAEKTNYLRELKQSIEQNPDLVQRAKKLVA